MLLIALLCVNEVCELKVQVDELRKQTSYMHRCTLLYEVNLIDLIHLVLSTFLRAV